jgi:hypothetical protein
VVGDRLAPHPATTRQPIPRQDVHLSAPQARGPPQTSMKVSWKLRGSPLPSVEDLGDIDLISN